jgi:hypothetical protein
LFFRIKEELNFQSENVLLSTWQQCDGPGLKYEKSIKKGPAVEFQFLVEFNQKLLG